MRVSSQTFNITSPLQPKLQMMERVCLVNAHFIELETITCSSAKRILDHSNTMEHRKSRTLLIPLNISDHKLPKRNIPWDWKMIAIFLPLKVLEITTLVYIVEVDKSPRASFSPTRFSVLPNMDNLMSRYHPLPTNCAETTCWLAVRFSKAWTFLLNRLRVIISKTLLSRPIIPWECKFKKTNRFGTLKT